MKNKIVKIHVVSKKGEIITIDANSIFGELSFRFEKEDGSMMETPILTKSLIKNFLPDQR